MDKCYLCLRGESNELRDKELQGEVSDGVDVEGAGYWRPVLLPSGLLRDKAGVTQPSCSWEPAGAFPESGEELREAAHSEGLLHHLPVVIDLPHECFLAFLKLTKSHLMLHGVPELRLVHQPVHDVDVRPLGLEGAKQPVPDDEEAGVVLVQAVPVGPVVDPVVAGRVEHELQGPEVGHQLRVYPELVEQIQLLVDEGLAGWDEQS